MCLLIILRCLSLLLILKTLLNYPMTEERLAKTVKKIRREELFLVLLPLFL